MLPNPDLLVARGWLRELTGYGRNRLWRYQPYVDLFLREALDSLVGTPPPAAAQVTGSAPGPAA